MRPASGRTGTPDLAYVESFHAVAQHGTLGAAARAIGRSVPTLSRHVAALEETHGVLLFDRRGGGLSLTETGAKLFEYAQAVREAGQKFNAAAAGTTGEIAGKIRISASRTFSNVIMPGVLRRLGTAYPEIKIELVVTDTASNLLMREADIGVRLYRPEQSTLIARQIGDVVWGAYAAESYIARKGLPQGFDDLHRFDIIGDDGSAQINRDFQKLGLNLSPGLFRYRCNDPAVAWRLVSAGCGIGLGYTVHAQTVPHVRRVLADALDLKRPVWLTSHAELKTSVRVRTVYDFLATELAACLKDGAERLPD